MKQVIAIFCLLGMASQAVAQNQSNPSSNREEIEYPPLVLLETWGWYLGQQYNLNWLEISEEEAEAIARGMYNYSKGEAPIVKQESGVSQLQNYLVARQERVLKEQMQRNKEEEQVFFDSLVGEPGIQSLATGLFFEIIKSGGDRKPLKSDTVRVNYRGNLLDGREFDSSYSRGEPSEFNLANVIPAWTQGLPLIGVGGKIKIYAPSKLAYGESGDAGIPPSAALIFEVELLEIVDDSLPSPPAAPQGLMPQ